MCKIMVHFSSINCCWFAAAAAAFVYLPNFFLKARVLFLNFLCLCLFIFKRRFRSTLVNSSSSTTLLPVGWDTEGCGGAGTEKGRRRETCSETLATDIVFLAIFLYEYMYQRAFVTDAYIYSCAKGPCQTEGWYCWLMCWWRWRGWWKHISVVLLSRHLCWLCYE